VDTLLDEYFGDSHQIFSESTGFIGADIISATHSLASLQISDQVVLLFHLSNAISQCDGNGKRKSFRHGNDNDTDSNNEILDDLMNGFSRDEAINKVDVHETIVQVMDKHGGKSSSCRNHAYISNLFGEIGQLYLKWCLILILLNFHL
jgi:hypothetical protein